MMDPWWIGVGFGAALTILGLLLAVLRLGPQELTEINVKVVGAKTTSVGSLAFLVGVAMLIFSLVEMGTPAARQGSEAGVAPASPVHNVSPRPRTKSPDAVFSDAYDGNALDSRWQVITGGWRTRDGVLEGRSHDGFAVLTLDQPIPPRYEVAVKVRFVDGVLAEVVLNLSRNRYVRAYLYEIDQDVVLGSGEFIGFQTPVTPGSSSPDQMRASVGGGASLAEQAFPVQKHIWYRFAADVRGSVYSVKVGGQELIRYRDVKQKLSGSGSVGLIVNGGSVQFDDFTIRKLH